MKENPSIKTLLKAYLALGILILSAFTSLYFQGREEAKPQTEQVIPLQIKADQPPAHSEVEQKKEKKEVIVYITRTGEKFHRNGCQYLRRSKIPMDKKDAIARGYSACSRCRP
jgi:competence protein ComEC